MTIKDKEKTVIIERRIEFTQDERCKLENVLLDAMPQTPDGIFNETEKGVFVVDYFVPDDRKAYGTFIRYSDGYSFFACLSYVPRDFLALELEDYLLREQDVKATDFMLLDWEIASLVEQDPEAEKERWDGWTKNVKIYVCKNTKSQEAERRGVKMTRSSDCIVFTEEEKSKGLNHIVLPYSYGELDAEYVMPKPEKVYGTWKPSPTAVEYFEYYETDLDVNGEYPVEITYTVCFEDAAKERELIKNPEAKASDFLRLKWSVYNLRLLNRD